MDKTIALDDTRVHVYSLIVERNQQIRDAQDHPVSRLDSPFPDYHQHQGSSVSRLAGGVQKNGCRLDGFEKSC
jgi:hypothetical protein